MVMDFKRRVMGKEEFQDHQKAEDEMYNKIMDVIDHTIMEWDVTTFQVLGCLSRITYNIQQHADSQENE